MDSDLAARERFHSFKMGGDSLHTLPRHSHGRSHSRNNSTSSFPLSASAPSLRDSPPLNANASLNPPSKRPSSHHHRRSSVSTRRESAELMGVSLPDLPTAHSDDNINLGDRDSIRRRALWALEGRPDLAFSKVEIPDIPSPDADSTKPFEFPTKPSFPPGSGLNTAGFAAKRDSFGKMFGASKDQLGTLVEEEEEEEVDSTVQRKASPQQAMAPAKLTTRHRPASLNLRPLSLVQGTIVSAAVNNLPSPTLTPGTRANARKPFAGASLDSSVVIVPRNVSVRQFPSARRFSYTCIDNTPAPCVLDGSRRSSISYRRSAESIPRDMYSLPSPEMTPTERRFSIASDQETLIDQPLSAADQNFLYKSHQVLLSRITELERSLKSRTSPSLHIAYPSDIPTASPEPNDEMLQLISDLKAERDELRRDVDGWRQRVADADKQASILAKRMESERREAWVARSRLGMLEVDKSRLDKSLEAKTAALSRSVSENGVLMRERDEIKGEIMKLNARLKDMDTAVEECARLRAALEQERTRRKELEKLLDDAGLLSTPKLPHTTNGTWRRPAVPTKPASTRPRGLGFQSVDSESSTTDVESADDSFTKAEFTLDVVAEEEIEFSDEENGLAGYEDEEDSDLCYSSPDGSSAGSADELDDKPETPIRSDLPVLPNRPAHMPRASLSKTWVFPRGKTAAHVERDDEVDRFFGCLDDVNVSPPHSEEMDKSTFSSVFRFAPDDEELPPFVLPSDVGIVVESTSTKSLDVVAKDDVASADDEFFGEEVEGGIRFTFNPPPPTICVTPPTETSITTPVAHPVSNKPIPILEPVEDDEDESALTFVFPPKAQTRLAEHTPSPPRPSPPTSGGCFRPSSRNGSPPSSIPRAVSLRSMSPKSSSIVFTPSKSASGRFTAPSAYSTHSSKKTVSSMPQPSTPPKAQSAPTKVHMSTISSKQSQSSTPPRSKLFMNAPVPRKVAAPRRK